MNTCTLVLSSLWDLLQDPLHREWSHLQLRWVKIIPYRHAQSLVLRVSLESVSWSMNTNLKIGTLAVLENRYMVA